MRGENKIVEGEARMLSDFRCVAMSEYAISAEILIHFNEMSFALGLLARAAHSRFAIAYDASRGVERSSFYKRTQAQDHRGCIATWISHQAGFRQNVGIKFGQAIHRFRKCF